MNRKLLMSVTLYFLLVLTLWGGCTTQPALRSDASSSSQVLIDTVKAGEFDTGKMWTFDYPPIDYFKRAYSFTPSNEWFEKARLAALRLPNCTASFVSEDGLLFTNDHCARGPLDAVNREGENLAENGFYAPTLADERKVPNLYVDQLVLMEDVTEEVVKAFESGTTDEERVVNRTKKIGEIEKRYREKTGLTCNVVTFYNGGKYSVYGYKRYSDIRVVFAPEEALGFFGGDYDNFTYPRYDLDISFFRVYDDQGKPLKTGKFFKWSKNGASEGEPVFVVGNPGRTSRLLTVAQLEFNRDYTYPFALSTLTNLVKIYSDHLVAHPEKKLQYQTQLYGYSNSQKVYAGLVKGLHDPVIIAKKRDFERKFKDAIMANSALRGVYAMIWSDIESVKREKAATYPEYNALNLQGTGRSALLGLASGVVEFANISKLPQAEQGPRLRGVSLDSLRNRLAATSINQDIDGKVLAAQFRYMMSVLSERNPAFNKLLAGKPPEAAASGIMLATVLTNKDRVRELLSMAPDEILNSADPLIAFVAGAASRAQEVRTKYSELQQKEQAKLQVLGKALYDVYGTSIPPDATFTLRLADGVVRNYEYNGTVAPVFTTFYGLYDRYNSYEGKDPWRLPDRWKNPPASFDLSTRYNFISTNDIIGGNSGSPVLNKDLEVVGIAFDGNIESLPGDFIFDDTQNRCVSVHSSGILEALEDIYKADRVVKELKSGRLQ